MKYIIRKRALGDVLWIEPVIRKLAETNEKLIVHTKYNALFDHYPLKNVIFKNKLSFAEKVVIRLEKISGTRFFVINLDDAYEKLPKFHFLNAYQHSAGIPITEEYPKLYLSDAEKTYRPFAEKYVVLHLESFSDKNFRQVYGIDWNGVVNFINAKGYEVAQVGVNNKPISGTTHQKTTIRQLISLINHSSYFIGLDSGPSHIAAALQVPSIIFFGAVNPLLRHFPNLFRGILVKQTCEYDGNDNIFNYKNLKCTLADKSEIPKCCTYTTESIIAKIEELLSIHAEKDN